MEGTGHPSQPRSLNIVKKEAPPRCVVLLKGIAKKNEKRGNRKKFKDRKVLKVQTVRAVKVTQIESWHQEGCADKDQPYLISHTTIVAAIPILIPIFIFISFFIFISLFIFILIHFGFSLSSLLLPSFSKWMALLVQNIGLASFSEFFRRTVFFALFCNFSSTFPPHLPRPQFRAPLRRIYGWLSLSGLLVELPEISRALSSERVVGTRGAIARICFFFFCISQAQSPVFVSSSFCISYSLLPWAQSYQCFELPYLGVIVIRKGCQQKLTHFVIIQVFSKTLPQCPTALTWAVLAIWRLLFMKNFHGW